MGFKPREWTLMQDDLVRKLWGEGLFVRDIAWRLSIPRSSVNERIHVLQLPVRPIARLPGSWSPEKDQRLSALWAEGVPSPEIGRQMGGLSKNAIIGRAHRLKLPSRPNPIPTDRVPAPRRRPPVPKLPQLDSLRTPMLVHPATAVRAPEPMPVQAGRVAPCCWPIGEPRTSSFHYCDEPALPSRPYCQAHCEIAYVRVRQYGAAA